MTCGIILQGRRQRYLKFIGIGLMILLISIIHIEKVLSQVNMIYRSQPFIQNFTKEEYQAANQNWSIAQDKNGILYFGNTYGLLEFNGAEWNLHTQPDIPVVRSLYTDADGKIYCGSFEEFGYWERYSTGELYYTSISKKLIDQDDISNNTIWKIEKIGNYFYLHSFSKIYVYNGKEIKIISSDNTILPIFEYRGKPFISILNSGLFSINEDFELMKEPLPDFISNLSIRHISELNNDSAIIFTENNGLYLKAGDEYKEFDSPGYLILKTCHINRVLKINDSLFAIGTIGQGLFLIDHFGKIQSHIDKSNGLQNNTVLALWKDHNGNLWIGLDKGIDYAEITSPISIIEDKTGKLGSVKCSVIHNGKIYLGTNSGLFYSDWENLIKRENTEFTAVPGLNGHVISLDIIDGKLICGYNLGTCIIEENRIIRLSDIGGRGFLEHPYLKDIGYQGIYTGIALYKKNESGTWIFSKVLIKSDYTKYIQMDQEGNLWSSSYFKGIQMHQLNSSGDSIINTINFGLKDGFASDYYINVFKLGNRIIFSNGGIFFTYDYLTRKIIPFDWLNSQLGTYENSHILYKAGTSEYWFINRSALGQFHYIYDSLVLKHEIKYKNIHSSAMEYEENITKINEHNYIIGLDEGFAILDYRQVLGSALKLPVHNLKINRMQFLNQAGISQRVSTNNTSNPQISFKNRNCMVNFSIPGTTQELYTFSYRFSDLDSWIELGKTNVLRYNNLNSGSHLLEIKAVEEVTGSYNIVKYPFTILSPFYLHWIAFVAYFIILAILGLLALKIIKIRLERHKLQFREKTRIENERKIAELNQEYLKMELKNKSKELVNYSILLDKRNELLDRLKSIINKELDDFKAPPQHLKLKLIDFIDKNISNRNEWQIFKSHFDAANSEFLEKLKSTHNNLTPSDLRFCAFLRMNLTSKEISSLLSISLRSVEVKRYRLRKKLNLDHDKNLIEYLMNT